MINIYEKDAWGRMTKDKTYSFAEGVTVIELDGKIVAVVIAQGGGEDIPFTNHMTEEEFLKKYSWVDLK